MQNIKNLKNEKKDITIFVKGNKDYIQGTNKKINKVLENYNCNIIDCYNVEELDDIITVESNYNKILNTSGIIDIDK